jgi:hypothetical protein
MARTATLTRALAALEFANDIKEQADSVLTSITAEIRKYIAYIRQVLAVAAQVEAITGVSILPSALQNLDGLLNRAAGLIVMAESLYSQAWGYVEIAEGVYGDAVNMNDVLQDIIDNYDGSMASIKDILESNYSMLPAQAEAIAQAFFDSDIGEEDKEGDWIEQLRQGFNLPPLPGGGF